MYPLLLKIGPISIHTYGFMIALGFLFAVQLGKYFTQKSNIDFNKALDAGFIGLFSGFIGARALYVITRWSDFASDPMAIFRVWEGGLVFYGGIIVGISVGILVGYFYKMNIWRTLDATIPGINFAHALGRLGCLGAGCCYGKPTGSSFGIRFYSELIDPQLRGVPLHPTQLYEAGALFFLFFLLVYTFKKKTFDGQVILTYCMTYPIIRSIVEVFRGDSIRGFVIDPWLSTSQFISILVFMITLGFFIYRYNQVKKKLQFVKAAILVGLTFIAPLTASHPSLAREMTDMTGAKITLQEHPSRIVTLMPSLGELVADLVGEQLEKIVGVSEFTDYPPVLTKITNIGPTHKINLEKIISLKPDLVLATSDGNPKDQVLHLRELGIPVVIVNTKNLKEIKESILVVSEAVGKMESGRKMALQFEKGIENIRKKTQSRKKKVLLQLGDTPVIVAGGKSFLDEALQIVGAVNIYHDIPENYLRPSMEETLKRNPDLILVSAMGEELSPFKIMAEKWYQFNQLKAVQDKAIKVFHNDALLRPTLRFLEGLSLLERAIYGTTTPSISNLPSRNPQLYSFFMDRTQAWSRF